MDRMFINDCLSMCCDIAKSSSLSAFFDVSSVYLWQIPIYAFHAQTETGDEIYYRSTDRDIR